MFNRKFVRAAALAGAMAIPMATTASAQGPIIVVGGGLVNVVVTDVIDDLTVVVQDVDVSLGAALQLAANICDVNVNVLARQIKGGGAQCEATNSDQVVTIRPR